MDATSVKLKQIAISENTCILYTIIMIYSIYECINSENNLKIRYYIDKISRMNNNYFKTISNLV